VSCYTLLVEFNLHEWLNLALRWFHVIAGIMWIGTTYLFNWFERTFREAADAQSAKPNISGELWMVHGGGFYLVEKQKKPELMPRTLHWFKYESLLTWLSGFLLFIVVYYMGGLFAENPVEMTETTAIVTSLGLVVAGVLFYFWFVRFAVAKSEILGGVLAFVAIVLLTYALTRIYNGRAAYLQFGAMLGTIMVANVWMTILPGQSKMIEAVKKGEQPNMELGKRGALCSKHNTYMSVPLVLIMVSNHFPTAAYGSQHNWIVLSLLVLVGWGAAKLIRG
jgi:uncharacterized membrane protein